VLNNVETLANVPQIIYRGANWFNSLGTEKSAGTKVFALSGRVSNIGLIEVPMGTPLRSIIYDIGGGIPDGRKFKAVQLGGPSGGCIPATLIDTPVDYENIAKTGAIVGSGGMVVMDDTTCMVDLAKFFLGFTAEESCGKCTPCREGTQQLLQILERITRGEGVPEDLDRLESLSRVIQSASLCGLGQTAPNPVLSTLRYFRDEYEAHIYDKHCATGICKRISPPPCQAACPIGQDVATYTALIAHGKVEKAWEIIRKENPFPMVLGRVCPHPCEDTCTRGDVDRSITICALKRFAADSMREKLQEIEPPPILYPEDKVAVIGAGPAGLTVAHDLAYKGYPVTVFDRLPVAGGNLYALPEDFLPREIIEEEVEAIKRLGIEFRLGVSVGSGIYSKADVNFDDLKREGYMAFFLGVGSQTGLVLPVSDRGHVGWIGRRPPGMPYGTSKKGNGGPGRRVCVLGSGGQAISAARTLRRQGAEDIHVICREDRERMSADPGEIEAALSEGIKIEYLTSPVRIVGDEDRVKGLECIRNRYAEPEADGLERISPVKGSEFTIDCDLIIPAVNEEPDLTFLQNGKRFEFSRKNPLIVDEETMGTNIPGFFTGGDAITGPTIIVNAIAAGHRAAVSIDCDLRGKPYSGYWYPKPHLVVDRIEETDEEATLYRPPAGDLAEGGQPGESSELPPRLDASSAIFEARRCLRCDL
jgi:NADH-quinone oxidoreductase subunit F